MNELGGVLEAVHLDLIKEALLTREFELDNRTDNEMQPHTTKSIESAINILSNVVSDLYGPPLPLPHTPLPPRFYTIMKMRNIYLRLHFYPQSYHSLMNFYQSVYTVRTVMIIHIISH